MKINVNDIREDEIRIIGGEPKGNKPNNKLWIVLAVTVAIAVIATLLLVFTPGHPHQNHNVLNEERVENRLESALGNDSEHHQCAEELLPKLPLRREADRGIGKGFVEIQDTIINDIPMKIYIPHQLQVSLHLGAINRNDPSIIFTAQAADVRADNGGVVGAYVLDGEPKAWGLSKKGFCAIINDSVTVGVSENSPLFEEATEKKGYFFRQFPLVDNGQLVESEQRGKSVRRALCQRNNELLIIETMTAESFHDFSQALVDMGIDNAIYLVGGNAYGWAVDSYDERFEFGDPTPKRKTMKNINYIVMRNYESVKEE